MAYEKNTWATGDVITAEKLNNIEDGIDGAGGAKNVKDGTGDGALVEGYNDANAATGNASHAEGSGTTASGSYSHAEGLNTQATSQAAHAEGTNTIASNTNAHAEGNGTEATGGNSHAEGSGTIAKGMNQHVFGRLNIADLSNLEIVGNGKTKDLRSNARTLSDQGHEWLSGQIRPEQGLRLKAPNGTYYNVTVDNNGKLSVTAV